LADQAARYDVCVVVDPSYPGRLEDLAAAVPVWIVSSAVNREACQRVPGRQCISDHHLPGCITSYDVSDPEDRASNLLNVVPVLEEHYGDPDDPVYQALPNDVQRRYLHLPNGFGLSVVGLNLTSDLERRLEDFGFESFLAVPKGFQAWVRRKRAS
jgi:hypothetical protein